MKIQIHSEQNYNGAGSAGVLMFLGGPILSGIGWNGLMGATYGSLTGYWIAIWLGAIAFQVGCVFMLVGRKYDHQVTVEPTQTTAKKTEPAEWN
ncbi:hypothetical protein [Mesorhizobium sp.]|uniref:hypothetical protein n=1 Tax=Mesorhizobium sp. TaxID=1871066 RepID=UPI000FE35BE5|nr:hypothetical protein [Mesorhizobium sp.]RWK29752.1 MAG: hypothetical protein EOR40_26600 [Mesorhizobium sp.]TJW03689.1 MAG: hypothetical protein E5X42_30585 [Mesorhizobium sp.]